MFLDIEGLKLLWTNIVNKFASKDELNNTVGDIETALDNIIEIQDGLINQDTIVMLDELHEYAQTVAGGGSE